MRIIISGATGMVGSEAIRQALLDKDIASVTAIVRKPLEITNPKLKVILHKDFLNFENLLETFKENDACLWCLGISQTRVKSEEEYHAITYDYAVNAASAMLKANPEMRFLFLSGMGADSLEKSRTLFARIKGKTENALLKIYSNNLYIVRPGGIKPAQKNPNSPLAERLLYPFFPIFKLLMPSMMITAVQLSQVMLYLVKKAGQNQLMENKELLSIWKDKLYPHL